MQLNTYKDINELPILNWYKVHKEEEYGCLLKDNKELTSGEIVDLLLLWDVLNNQFIERFGLSDEFRLEMDVRNKIAEYTADHIITGDNYYRTMIRIEETKLKMFNTDIKSEDGLERMLVKMSRSYGFKLDSRDLTTEQYYSYLYELLDGKKVSK